LYVVPPLTLLCLVSGATRSQDSKDKSTPKGVDAAWVYRSELGFTLRLPDKSWKEVGKGKNVVNFANRFPFEMAAGVLRAEKQSLEEYQARVQKMKEYLKGQRETLLGDPEMIEETTKMGDRRFCIIAKEKGQKETTYILAGLSYTWIKSRGLMVEVVFEGTGKYDSMLFKAREKAAFEAAVRTICLSVE
jgi:hypothetical protein